MAQTTPLARHLQVQFQNGTGANGKPKVKNQSYAHVSPTAVDDDILAVGQALAGLSSQTLIGIARLDQVAIAPDATSSGTSGSSGSTGSGTTSSGTTSGTTSSGATASGTTGSGTTGA